MPSKKGNINGLKNGSRIKGAIARLNLGELPGTLRRQLSTARKYRRNLEDACEAVHGSVSLTMAHHIDAATRAQCHISICQYLLRDRWEKMSENDIMTASREITKAAETRNRAFTKLELEKDQENIIQALYHVDNGERMPSESTGKENETQPPHQDGKPSEGQSEDG